ncbi:MULTISPECIES: cupin domain-containing protein [unclassified Paraburkholderia]|uniref:cupin domain-containing protein n=1 Tax=unclassified Paraburkholderia TaxID=2615204 RepID=UPI002AB0ED62|nr:MULTISPECIES: cupin domain-containing protein [unclassified Paraburkholderia]
MLVNADFSRRAVVASESFEWVRSPQNGVERVMLDRVTGASGHEKARATSLVRYARDSHFPRHTHDGGEEILVLSGCFSEDEAHYPAGWYLRNPPGSSHRPASREGALIFVKLGQMMPSDQRSVRIDTYAPDAWKREQGREVCPLFADEDERVMLARLAPGERVLTDAVKGAELLVLDGEVIAEHTHLLRGGWLRLPAGTHRDVFAGAGGAMIYLKRGAFRGLPIEVSS